MVKGVNKGESNGIWIGDRVSCGALHAWVRRNMPMPEYCAICNDKKPIDLANISNKYNPKTYTRDFNNWRYLCRSCHMKSDGRMKNLKIGGKIAKYKTCLYCDNEHHAKHLCVKHYCEMRRKNEMSKVWQTRLHK